MMRNPFGWDLPPGCTNRHIDEAFGGGPEEPPELLCVTCAGSGMREETDGRVTTCDACGGSGLLADCRCSCTSYLRDPWCALHGRDPDDERDARMDRATEWDGRGELHGPLWEDKA
jgi:hypothetical protein